MITPWIQPLLPGQWSALSGPEYPLAGMIGDLEDFNTREPRIALIGLDAPAAWQIRTQFYRFSGFRNPEHFRIFDLGDFRRSEPDFLIPAIKVLIEGNTLPILFGGTHRTTYSLFHVFQQLNRDFHGVFIDESIRKEDACIEQILSGEFTRCKTAINLGWQKHISDLSTVEQLAQKNLESRRLGSLRDDIEDAEPLIRISHFVDFQVSALARVHAPGQAGISSSGLTGDEACQLMRYAGFNPKMRCLAVSGLQTSRDPGLHTANIMAQMMWYFLDGRLACMGSSQNMTEYIVAFKEYPLHLSFYKHEQTGRWWVDIPGGTPAGSNGNGRRFPCTYKDYRIACQDRISERILGFVNHLL